MHVHTDVQENGIVLFNFKTNNTLFEQVRVKKFVPNKKGDIGMEVHYVCQPNTHVIAREFGEQQ